MRWSVPSILLCLVPWAGLAADVPEAQVVELGAELETLGDPLLVNFWASWCGPCREELPALGALRGRLEAEGAVVVGVNLDRHRRRPEALLRHLEVDLPMVWDPKGEIAARFQPGVLPTTFLVDGEGRVHAVYEGALDGEGLRRAEEEVRHLLKRRDAPETP